jgi:hypothetical protein
MQPTLRVGVRFTIGYRCALAGLVNVSPVFSGSFACQFAPISSPFTTNSLYQQGFCVCG